MTGIDNNVLNYLFEAMHTGQIPAAAADVAEQQVTSLRLFLWTSDLVVGRVVSFEAAQARDAQRRALLHSIIASNLAECEVPEQDLQRWQVRAAALAAPHPRGLLDCLLVAEAEIVGADTLLTFDTRMINRLTRHTPVKLIAPATRWRQLGIPRGTPPIWQPASSNPLSAEPFWSW